MKKFCFFIASIMCVGASAQSVGIGTNQPNSSAALEIKNSTKGILIPRTSSSSRTAIANPAKGLLLYDTTTSSFWFYNASAWVQIGNSGWSLAGNAGTSAASNFIGTTDAKTLQFKVNNTRAGYLDFVMDKGNTSFGFNTLAASSGPGNTATGFNSLQHNTEGFYNTASGYNSLIANTAGSLNVADGSVALFSNDSGSYNTASGYSAAYNNTSGSCNTVMGYSAFFHSKTGHNNTAIGYNALGSNTVENFNTAIGSDANVLSYGFPVPLPANNATAIGHGAVAYSSNMVRIGNYEVLSIGGSVDWSSTSDGRVKKNIRENVPGLQFINLLKPVTYNLNLDAADSIHQTQNDKTKNGKPINFSADEKLARKQKEAIVFTGFVAQEVEKTARSVNYDFSGVDVAKNPRDLYGLRYSNFVPPLVKAVQELSIDNDKKTAIINKLQLRLDALEQQLKQLELNQR